MDEQTVDFLKSRDWYKDNESVQDCIKVCEDTNHKDEKGISICNQILNLCDKGDSLGTDKFGEERKKQLLEIEDYKSRLKSRKRILNIMNECENKSTSIQDFFSNKITV
jgi:hypothetical protein